MLKRKRLTLRPWGNYQLLFQEAGVWVKRVEVKAKCRLSLQQHQRRSEKWIIVTGKGIATVNNISTRVKHGTVIDVPVRAIHRIGNAGKKNLVFIKVACGNYLSERDIKRLQDDYYRIL